MRLIQTSALRQDIDSAAKYIGAGAATVGVAGAGKYTWNNVLKMNLNLDVLIIFDLFYRCRYRNCFRQLGYRLCAKPRSQATALLLCYSRLCLVRSYGSLLSYDGFHVVVRFLRMITRHATDKQTTTANIIIK